MFEIKPHGSSTKIMSYNDIYTETSLLMSKISLTFALVLLPRDEWWCMRRAESDIMIVMLQITEDMFKFMFDMGKYKTSVPV